MAPEWTNRIPNYAICNFFYVFFIVYAVFAGLSFLNLINFFILTDKFDMKFATIFVGLLLTSIITLTLTLFNYLMCDRILMDKAIKDVEGFAVKATTTQVAAAKKTNTATTASSAGGPPKAPVKCVPGCVP